MPRRCWTILDSAAQDKCDSGPHYQRLWGKEKTSPNWLFGRFRWKFPTSGWETLGSISPSGPQSLMARPWFICRSGKFLCHRMNVQDLGGTSAYIQGVPSSRQEASWLPVVFSPGSATIHSSDKYCASLMFWALGCNFTWPWASNSLNFSFLYVIRMDY